MDRNLTKKISSANLTPTSFSVKAMKMAGAQPHPPSFSPPSCYNRPLLLTPSITHVLLMFICGSSVCLAFLFRLFPWIHSNSCLVFDVWTIFVSSAPHYSHARLSTRIAVGVKRRSTPEPMTWNSWPTYCDPVSFFQAVASRGSWDDKTAILGILWRNATLKKLIMSYTLRGFPLS